MSKEKYCFEITKEGQKSISILDKCFNPTTQEFLLANGLKANMRVLELGCAIGTMTSWLALQIGEKGQVLAIDNNEYQINAAQELALQNKVSNCQFKVMSAYDIDQLNGSFDLVYCRFLLHHLNEPDKVIAKVYEILKPNGIFVCEEGIVSHGFSYPPSDAFKTMPETDEVPDKNIGKKLFYKFYLQGFKNLKARVIQPLLVSKEEKALLLPGLIGSKRYFCEQGHTEAEWQHLYDETLKLIDNEMQIVGFYASGQVAGVKAKVSQ